MVLREPLVEVHILVLISHAGIHHIEAREVAAFTAMMVGRINPAVVHHGAIAPLSFANTPAAHIEIVLVLIGQLKQALTVDHLEHKFLVQVTEVNARLAPGIGGSAVLRVDAHILADTGALTDQVDIMHGLTQLTELGASLSIVKVDLAQSE